MNGRPSIDARLRQIADEIKAKDEALRRQQETVDAAIVTLALACLVFWLLWLTLKLAKAGLL